MPTGARADRSAGQAGFTLIELLVVIGIIAVLAAVVTFGVISFISNANLSSCQQEKKTVQSAMDAMMSAQNLITVSTAASPTNTWTAAPAAGAQSLSGGGYLRQDTTKLTYSWDAKGEISVVAGPPGC